MTAPAPLRRRRFYFSLRTLFVAVTILGVFLGWLGVQLKWIHDRGEALRWVIDPRARQLAAGSGSPLPPKKGSYVRHDGISARAPWSLRILGEAGIERLEVYQDWLNPDGPYSLDELRHLFPEAEVKAVTTPLSGPPQPEHEITSRIPTPFPD